LLACWPVLKTHRRKERARFGPTTSSEETLTSKLEETRVLPCFMLPRCMRHQRLHVGDIEYDLSFENNSPHTRLCSRQQNGYQHAGSLFQHPQ
jgi:hypothetical protein